METSVFELNGLLADAIIEVEEKHNIWNGEILELFQEIAERFQDKIASIEDKPGKIMKKLFYVNGKRVNEFYFRALEKVLQTKIFGIISPNKQEYFLGGD